MLKTIISYLILASICLLTLGLFLLPHPVVYIADEMRKTRTFPSLPGKLSSTTIQQFFQDVDGAVKDNLPLRTKFLDFATLMKVGVFKDNFDYERSYKGKEGWLFLGNYFARTVDKLIGRHTLTDLTAQQMGAGYISRYEQSKKLGVEYILVIGPNKSSVYPEYLPDNVVPAATRYITPLLSVLRDSGVPVWDPILLFQEPKKENPLYYYSDSHWNFFGASIAFSGLAAKMGWPPLPKHHFNVGGLYKGDLFTLGRLTAFYTPPSGDNLEIVWEYPVEVTKNLMDGKVIVDANTIPAPFPPIATVVNEFSTTDKTAWVFGDSFSLAFFPFMNATFRKVRYFYSVPQDWQKMLEEAPERPDIILELTVERSLG